MMKVIGRVFLICGVLHIQVILGEIIGYETNLGKKYLIENNEKFTWKEAWVQCFIPNYQLVILDTEEKNLQLQNLLKEINSNTLNNFWIGGKTSWSDQKELVDDNEELDVFYWHNAMKPFSYTYWHENHQNENITSDQCVYLANDVKLLFAWKSDSCLNAKKGFICEEAEFTKPSRIEDNRLDEPKQVSNSLLKWKEIIRKFMRKMEINIVKAIFNIETFFARLHGIEENEEN
ncbi:lectin subunit alpha-like isoform 2-T2 [Cochliomyia hominivorax]